MEEEEELPSCDNCGNGSAEIFQAEGNFCLSCWQKLTESRI
jgi:hypothetical protein